MILNVPVNNFSVMLGRSHCFLGITSNFGGVNMPCSRTQHGLTRVGLEPPTSGSGARGINHQATVLPQNIKGVGLMLHTNKNIKMSSLVSSKSAQRLLERRFLKSFYHIWTWQPSWSCDQHYVDEFLCPQL